MEHSLELEITSFRPDYLPLALWSPVSSKTGLPPPIARIGGQRKSTIVQMLSYVVIYESQNRILRVENVPRVCCISKKTMIPMYTKYSIALVVAISELISETAPRHSLALGPNPISVKATPD